MFTIQLNQYSYRSIVCRQCVLSLALALLFRWPENSDLLRKAPFPSPIIFSGLSDSLLVNRDDKERAEEANLKVPTTVELLKVVNESDTNGFAFADENNSKATALNTSETDHGSAPLAQNEIEVTHSPKLLVTPKRNSTKDHLTPVVNLSENQDEIKNEDDKDSSSNKPLETFSALRKSLLKTIDEDNDGADMSVEEGEEHEEKQNNETFTSIGPVIDENIIEHSVPQIEGKVLHVDSQEAEASSGSLHLVQQNVEQYDDSPQEDLELSGEPSENTFVEQSTLQRTSQFVSHQSNLSELLFQDQHRERQQDLLDHPDGPIPSVMKRGNTVNIYIRSPAHQKRRINSEIIKTDSNLASDNRPLNIDFDNEPVRSSDNAPIRKTIVLQNAPEKPHQKTVVFELPQKSFFLLLFVE